MIDIYTLQNSRAMIVGATGEFSFAENAPTPALAEGPGYGYVDFGNIIGVDLGIKVETTPVVSCYRGSRAEVLNSPTLTGMSYKVKSNEADPKKVMYALAGDRRGNHTQNLMAAVDADALAFSVGTPAALLTWYTVKVGGAKVRSLTAITVTGKVLGTDYVVDLMLGRIMFLTAQTAAVTPKVTGPAIAANTADIAMDIIEPLAQPSRRGYGRITFFDKIALNKVVYDHFDFLCEIQPDSNPIASQDGKSGMDTSFNIQVMTDRGRVAVRQ